MIVKGSNDDKKSKELMEVAQREENTGESAKLVVEEPIKIVVKESEDVKKRSCAKDAISYTILAFMTLFLFAIVLLAVQSSPFSLIVMKEPRVYISDVLKNFDDWRYDTYEGPNDVDVKITDFDDLEGALQCMKTPMSLRFDCYPGSKSNEEDCIKRGCCWSPAKFQFYYVPYCYYPDGWSIYKYENYSQENNNFFGFLTLTNKSPYKKDIPLVKMETAMIDSSILRVKIYDANNQRYEPPWPVRSDLPSSDYIPDTFKYRFITADDAIGFRIDRDSDDTILFNSIGTGGFIFADQFLEMSAILPSHNIYGIGEHQSNLKLSTDWQQFTLFNRDVPPTEYANLYGSHPFYFVIEDSGNCHGVLFLNSNAMEIKLQPAPAITIRTIGGIFDMYFLLGPTPQDVMRQYSEIIGKPFLPPYWSLGFHLCRYGNKDLNRTKEIWNRTRAAGIPFDTQWNDLDYMNQNNDFTYDKEAYKELPQFVDELHRLGMHYIPLIDAGISGSETPGTYRPYDEGVKQDIFVKDSITNQPFLGKVWNKVGTVWPDFTNPKTKDYYMNMMQDLHNSFPFDGAWIDMNEPSNFYNGHRNGCTHNELDFPEYSPLIIGRTLSAKTLCMDAKHYLGPHYNLHNTYGISHAAATNYALTNIRKKRPFVISRSTWIGHGFYAGHWSGDIESTWYDMRKTIPQILNFNLYQVPMMGADICGFNGNTTAALCNRWMQLGAFYPFSRNHNTDNAIDQDPVALGDLVVKSSKRALSIRYWLLPYLYTLFFRAHKFGETVARPLFFEFPNDEATYNIDTQFMWGSSLMINPVLEENNTHVLAYVPRGMWYNVYTKEMFFSIGEHLKFDAPLDTIPLLIRGGSILPAQKPGVTTTESRKNSFELVVALSAVGKAEGELYWDDGDSLDSVEKQEYAWLSFTLENRTLWSKHVQKGTFKDKMILGRIQILGVQQTVTHVTLNGLDCNFKYDASKWYISITSLLLDMQNPFKLSWEVDGKHVHKGS